MNLTRMLHSMLRSNGGAQYRSWPVMNGSGAGGTGFTAGAGAYSALADIIAAAAIAVEFYIAGLICYTTDAGQNYQVQLYDATLLAYRADFEYQPTTITLAVPTMFLPIPIYEAAGSQIQGRVGGPAAKTMNLHIVYLTGV